MGSLRIGVRALTFGACFSIQCIVIDREFERIKRKNKKVKKLKAIAADLKLSHTLFALPFALSGLVLGGVQLQSLTLLAFGKLLLCMFTARSFAMGMNRWLDRTLDAQNPRTDSRAIPSRQLKAGEMLSWSCLFGLGFVLAAFTFNRTTGLCSPVVLAILAGYSLMKRYTWGTHWYLGACLGLAPIAANIALQGHVPSSVLLLGLAITMWTAGFDILYATQDVAFDTRMKLYSVPVRFGLARSWWISAGCFACMILLLLQIGRSAPVGSLYYIGVFGVAGMLIYELGLVRDLAKNRASMKLDRAFFTVNGWVSVCFYICVQLDSLLQ